MIKSLLIILIQFRAICSDQSCGCNVGRGQEKDVNKNFFIDLNNKPEDKCDITLNPWNNSGGHNVENMVLIPSGSYQFGTDNVMIESDREGPKRSETIKGFYLDKYEVSNRDFNQFTELTKYKTEAETFGDSFVFSLFLNNTFKEKMMDYRVMQAVWWYKIFGADWRHPYGPDSDLSGMGDHPVVHVSWRDAREYCKWRGARLPTEAEWEAACRGGHHGNEYPWGNKLFPDKKHMANIWQGTFPNYNSAKDGYIGTNPVTIFPPNDFGLYNMAGNVWEWTEDTWSTDKPEEKVKKGGSYLCHKSYCYRYRCSARSHNTQDSSAGNLGFRCAKSV